VTIDLRPMGQNLRNDSEQPTLRIYHAPCACSRVVLNAIEEIGKPYEEVVICLPKRVQKSAEYLAINPKGKVPAIADNGHVITEAPAILYHLAQTHPEANLLPKGGDGRPTIDALSDLIWFSSYLHPAMNKVVFPQMTSEKDAEGIRSRASAILNDAAAEISSRYENGSWYYGKNWSILDVYVTWVYGLASQFGFDLKPFPTLIDARTRIEARPSFQKTRAVEIAAADRAEIPMPPGMVI